MPIDSICHFHGVSPLAASGDHGCPWDKRNLLSLMGGSKEKFDLQKVNFLDFLDVSLISSSRYLGLRPRPNLNCLCPGFGG